MTSDTQSSFSDTTDANLRQAVRKCWAGECCPVELRRRVQAMLADAENRRPAGPFSTWGRWIIYPVAAAAAMAVVFGLALHSPPATPAPTLSAAVMPASLQTDLVRTHDRCSQKSNHQSLPGDSSDDASLARTMSAQLHRPVLVGHPSESGWDFRGAAVCSVGSTKSSHLVFTSGSDALSIFSLPKSSMPNAVEGSEFETVVDGHPIVGFVRDGAVFCLVGSGPDANVSAARLEKLRTELKPQITQTASARNTESSVVAVELIRPIDH